MIKSLIEDSRKVDLNERNKKEIWSFRHKLVEAILDAGAVDSNGYVTKKTQEDADAACMGAIYGSLPRCIKLRNGVNGFYPGIVLCEKRRPFKSNDLALLMFDRDYWESPDENIPDEVISKQSHNSYLEIVKRCLDMNYTPVLSTPLFEFWLLMHHKDDIGDVKKYKMDLLSSRDKIERKLRDLEGYKDNGKRLSEERKRFYVKTFPEAVEVSKILETDPLELIFKSGTNVGVVLMGLMDQRR